MHLDKWPSSLGAGPQKINSFEPQYSRHYWGWALGKRGDWISWFLNCTFTTLEPRPTPWKYPADKTWHQCFNGSRTPRHVEMGPKMVPDLRGHSPTQPRCSSAREGCLACGASTWPRLKWPTFLQNPRGVGVPSALETYSLLAQPKETSPPLPLTPGMGQLS